jgi:hypothetical protein
MHWHVIASVGPALPRGRRARFQGILGGRLAGRSAAMIAA